MNGFAQSSVFSGFSGSVGREQQLHEKPVEGLFV